MAEQHWMQNESEREKRKGTKGSLKRAAKRAGMSTREFAEKHEHSPGLVGKRSRLAMVYMNADHSR